MDIIVCMYVCEMKILSRHRSAHCDVIYCITSIRGKERHGWNDMKIKYFEGGEGGGGVGRSKKKSQYQDERTSQRDNNCLHIFWQQSHWRKHHGPLNHDPSAPSSWEKPRYDIGSPE